VHTLRGGLGGRENVGVLKEGPNSWERLPNGDWVVTLEGKPNDEFVLPASSVKYEKRTKVAAKQQK
jgi:hypothetical protein